MQYMSITRYYTMKEGWQWDDKDAEQNVGKKLNKLAQDGWELANVVKVEKAANTTEIHFILKKQTTD